MKLSGYVMSLCLFATVATSCKGSGKKVDYSNAGGKPYELVVSIPQDLWDGAVGDTLRSVLQEPIPMFNQEEPHFDVARVQPSAMTDLLLRHRNILVVQVSPDIARPVSAAQYNVYAQPQIMVSLGAPDAASLAKFISENRKEIQLLFDITERNRAVENNNKYGERSIENEVYHMFGIKLGIPRGFSLKSKIGEDFMWIGNDVRTATQGISIYSYPYSGKEDFTKERLIERRDEFVSKIPGPSDGSYMITEDYIEPEVTYIHINGRQWAEMRGFWDVKNDFMGGPFVNFSTVDPKTGNIISIDCFVHSPKDPKRNLMKQLEHIIYSVEFEG